jgi:glycosyltransferase involved in cell wall biosynthesis
MAGSTAAALSRDGQPASAASTNGAGRTGSGTRGSGGGGANGSGTNGSGLNGSGLNGSGAHGGAPSIISLGRLERYKGHHRAIEAMPALRERVPAARLHVAGSGPDEDRLRRLTADLGLSEVVTIGPIDRAELPSTLARTDLVVLLSDYEAHPVAVAEAIAAGCRVLTADTTGFRELAEEGLVRAIAPDSGPDVVAAAIEDALAAPAPSEPPDLPTWDDTTAALEALYRRILAEG